MAPHGDQEQIGKEWLSPGFLFLPLVSLGLAAYHTLGKFSFLVNSVKKQTHLEGCYSSCLGVSQLWLNIIYVSVDFPRFLMLLMSSFKSLWSKIKLWMSSILVNLLRLALWLNKYSILNSIPCVLEKMYVLLKMEIVLYRPARFIWYKLKFLQYFLSELSRH